MVDPPDHELAVFSAARRLPADDRAAYLDNACAGEAGLRQRVEELLQAGEEAGAFLESPAAMPPGHIRMISLTLPSAEKPGDRIGRYKLLQQIGEGGCGVVYMAEQEEPVRPLKSAQAHTSPDPMDTFLVIRGLFVGMGNSVSTRRSARIGYSRASAAR
jgi:hypothetical protein